MTRSATATGFTVAAIIFLLIAAKCLRTGDVAGGLVALTIAVTWFGFAIRVTRPSVML